MITFVDFLILSSDNELNESLVSESAIRAFKRFGKKVKAQYRCTIGKKKGEIVSNPKACGTRKNMKLVRHGRKMAITKRGVRLLKTKISKKSPISKLVSTLNKRLAGIQK